MPTLPDLELNDFDLKPYMDPSILLDTFSAEDMDIWQSYNLFVDDNINNSSLKEQIKEENPDIMDCCFSSICPNDLINSEIKNNNQNSNNLQGNNGTNNGTFNFSQQQLNNDNNNQIIYTNNNKNYITYEGQSSNEYYSTNSSSCSSSPSNIESNSNQYFHDSKPTIHLNIDSLGFNRHNFNNSENTFPNVFESNSNIFQSNIVENSNLNNDSSKVEYFQINTNNNSETEVSLSPSSSVSSSVSSSINGDFHNNFQNENKNSNLQFIQKNCSKRIQKINCLQSEQPIIVVEASSSSSITQSTHNTTVTSQKLNKKSANVLPPSPPSSFGSDSESNQSTENSVMPTKMIGLKSNKNILKSNKLNNQLRSNATIIKQMRHQPYSFKAAHAKNTKAKVTIKTESILDTSNSLLNLSTNSDDDCWPFLCSLSKLPSSGPIMLTEEEKRTLVQEGHQVPSQLPLTKSEEKVLKKIRRKIKNKISAQESRRKKKEYVDSLEKRMESYIHENVELKKRLENLEINNKNLIQQLQKLTTNGDGDLSIENESNNQFLNNTQNNTLNINSANQFGTLLMVLVLFFTVLLGVWSPLITKDSLGHASTTAAAAASISVRPGNRNSMNSISYSAASATTTAAVAVASLAVASSVAQIKTESLSPPQPTSGEEEEMQISNFNTRPVIMKNDDEDDFLANDAILTGQINNNNLITRSKAGIAVELTKVRPFIRSYQHKLPTGGQSNQKNQQQQNVSDYVILNNNNNLPYNNQNNQDEAQQIIILNLASNNNQGKISDIQQNTENSSVKSLIQNSGNSLTNNSNIPVNFISTNGQIKPLNTNNGQSNLIQLNGVPNSCGGGGYRVINTVQNANAQKLTACTANSTNKQPTRFRLINNGISAFNNHNLAPSVIKLNTLA